MTIKDAAEQILGINALWDSALPQEWCDDFKRVVHAHPHAFVWVYDDLAGFTGRPCALNAKANEQLAEYNAARGCSHPLTANPVEGEE